MPSSVCQKSGKLVHTFWRHWSTNKHTTLFVNNFHIIFLRSSNKKKVFSSNDYILSNICFIYKTCKSSLKVFNLNLLHFIINKFWNKFFFLNLMPWNPNQKNVFNLLKVKEKTKVYKNMITNHRINFSNMKIIKFNF